MTRRKSRAAPTKKLAAGADVADIDRQEATAAHDPDADLAGAAVTAIGAGADDASLADIDRHKVTKADNPDADLSGLAVTAIGADTDDASLRADLSAGEMKLDGLETTDVEPPSVADPGQVAADGPEPADEVARDLPLVADADFEPSLVHAPTVDAEAALADDQAPAIESVSASAGAADQPSEKPASGRSGRGRRRKGQAARAAADAARSDMAGSDDTPDLAQAEAPEQDLSVYHEPPLIQIELDPAVSGGFIHGRFDILLRGRVLSRTAVEEVALHVDGEVPSIAQFGQPDRAAPATLPDGTRVRQRAFQFTLPRTQGRAAAPCQGRIVARTPEGFVAEEAFELVVDPTGPEPVALIAATTQSVGAYAGVRPPVVVYVERAALDGDGILLVHGWAVSLTSIVTVQVYAGETRLAAAKLGGEREDVANVYPAYPNARTSGFTLTKHLAEEDRDATAVRVQGISLHGFAHEVVIPLERVPGRGARASAPGLGAQTAPAPLQAPAPAAPQAAAPAETMFPMLAQRPIYQIKADFSFAPDPIQTGALPDLGRLIPARQRAGAEPRFAAELPPPPVRQEIHMFCDSVSLTVDGYLTVSGWAVCADEVASVYIYLDGILVGEADYGGERPDVGGAFSNIANARRSGFLFDRRVVDLADGDHSVRLLVRSRQGEEKDEIFPIDYIRPAAVVIPPKVEEAEPAEEQQEFRFEQDSPPVFNGAVTEPVTGRLTIEGWVLARSGVVGIDVQLDGQRLGEAHYGLARQDVGAAFPEWDNALRSGYAFHCPPRSLRDGEHSVRLTVRARNGAEFRQVFTITVKKSEDSDETGSIRRRISRVESDLFDSLLAGLGDAATGYRPRVDLFLWQNGDVDPDGLAATLDSLRLQAYADWRLVVLADSVAALGPVSDVVDGFADDLMGRVSVVGPGDAGWTAPLCGADAAGLTLVGMLCPGDQLGSDALAELVLASGLHPSADFLYADENRHNPASREREAFCKPDYSPDLLLSTNYIGHPWIAHPALIAGLGISPASLAAEGEYDLILRAIEQARQIRHVPKILCRRGMAELDTPAAAAAALRRSAVRRQIEAEVLPAAVPGTWRFKRAVKSFGKVSIIIPTCAAHGYIETCLDTLRSRTTYPDYEIIVVDNIPDSQMAWKIWLQQNADKVVDMPDMFNWSRFNNLAADVADGDYLLFLNDDIEFEQDDWLELLVEHAQRPEVGLVGARLLYPDRKVQHAGMFLAENGIGRHAFRFAAEDEPGYFGLALTQRNVMAVTGACMLVRREVFDELGQFDEAHQIVNNDLDFCLRVHKAGLLTVFTPYATLIHHELASRDRLKDVFDLSHFNAQWKTQFAAGDPYFSPLLSRNADDYRPDDEPVQVVHAGHPLFHAADIKRILVVKLDHIGDFVTALPAIRRLKHLFPQARLSVLAGPASQAFASMEPAIDDFIAFEFFHARSQLGERELTADDYDALAAQLRPYRFDLAVDLRKHLSTRDVLRYTGALFLAGFDYQGQFPFLDIALEWDGDKTLQRKRGHVVDDLLSLVEAIGTAAEDDRLLLQPPPEPTPIEELPDAVRPLFDKPVVAIHPGAGNITKQWPEEHFSALIDLLTERNGVNVLLVGGPDEVALADSLMQDVLHPDAVASMAGQTSLAALPRLLAACTLYIGNDSGPKHIAAALGVPTIGIHSGVVDATEWGPVGGRAVALRRNMTCSPCYLAVASDCPRDLACLRFLTPTLVHQAAEMMLGRSEMSAAEVAGVAETAAEPEQQEAAPGLADVVLDTGLRDVESLDGGTMTAEDPTEAAALLQDVADLLLLDGEETLADRFDMGPVADVTLLSEEPDAFAGDASRTDRIMVGVGEQSSLLLDMEDDLLLSDADDASADQSIELALLDAEAGTVRALLFETTAEATGGADAAFGSTEPDDGLVAVVSESADVEDVPDRPRVAPGTGRRKGKSRGKARV